ncbi:TetR/AcrR family transcriptional regulator [Nocardia cyriacigeorgica]|uniref:TetR/AcrR family transcriptional regulator n=1 Tax=Nocardia cyriacigeorgica TaxID=135487 RepID=UPI001892DD13|nr:TetR/AcrR family transcriptional regulator [Nocardia cyriacigeorgica]MBF6454997.1 TetR/AcrR family transcriptional regulator [Nocardia cyriacigeorgica]MBF6479504.1 TetR/AcrR family transcriptional regulator [Nocardia cyriacigeorgica]MBF6552892.1 TetR/AcrR family transcriptional regulator [Nocardia cyriacigeorgica]
MEVKKRPGGRSARVRDAVRAATIAELAEHGYPGLTMENVAKRSGVHKTTVYRRWTNPEGLIADALDLAATEPWPIPDTGSIEGDLCAIVELVRTGFADPQAGPISTAFITAAMQNPSAATALNAFFTARHQQSARVIERAVGRGELPANVDAHAVIRFAVAPIYYRLFVSHEPVTVADSEAAARAAIAAARAGAL